MKSRFPLLLLGLSLPLSVAAIDGIHDAVTPLRRTDGTNPEFHELLVKKVKQGKIDVYFEGDSITRRWAGPDYPEFLEHWNASFHGWNAANFGVGGDTTQNMLWRLQNGEFEGVSPKVIVLLAGTNNVGREPAPGTAENTAKGVRALLDVFREKAPGAKILLMAVFPRNDSPLSNPVINDLNRRIEAFADGEHIHFLNINSLLADEAGVLHPGVTVDQLHLSRKGYEIWFSALKPLLTEWLGAPAAVDEAPPQTAPVPAKAP